MTVSAYDRSAREYLAAFSNYRPYVQKVLEFQRGYLRSHSRVLDVGCGPGINAKLLFERDHSLRITGIDLSAEMIQLARRQLPDCTFRVEDIRDFTTDDRYDAIVASFCIVHLTTDEARNLIQRLAKILTGDGSMYLSFMEGSESRIERTSFSDTEMHFNYYRREVVEDILHAAGFRIEKTSSEDYQESDGTVTKDLFFFVTKG